MGCIETRLIFRHRLPVQGLTLTWDVLKLRGMKEKALRGGQINFNMGCIETQLRYMGFLCSPRLTLTWDVLKQKGEEVTATAGKD